MKVPQLARYNGTVATAYKFAEDNIIEYPITPIDLIKKFKWGLLTYEEMALKNNCTIEDVCECLGTDGYSIYNGCNYTIAYNNKIKSQGRIDFTLAHEIGHIVLDHHKDFDVTSILKDNFTKEEYRILENEANCFARNILAPAPLIKQLPFWNIFDIQNYFNITFKAISTRISFLNNDLYYLTDADILNMQQKYNYYLLCSDCNTKYINKNSKYCPICGHSKLKKGNGFIMKTYKKIDIKDLGECPICENSDIANDNNYCKICGLSLKNECANCQIELDSNSRFCTNCGSISTFYKNKILKSWETENLNYNISSLELKKYWQNFISYLKSNGRIVLYTNLLNSELVLLTETTIGINFINGITNFGYAVLSKKENLDYIQEHISTFTGKTIKAKFLNNGKEFKNTQEQQQNNETASNYDELPF